jgi:pimeloyl-[acyl-carrier protein] methyl ester esterase
MHIECVGRGPDLILLHGWAMHSGIFAPLIKQLENDFTLHLVDLPGHGYARELNMPDSVNALCNALSNKLPSGIYLGWSLGGLLAMQMAARFANKVEGLIALCTTPCFVQRNDWSAGMLPSVFEQFAAGLQQDFQGTIDRFLQLEAQGDAQLRDTLRWLRTHIFERGEPSEQGLQQGLEFLLKEDARALLNDISAPSLWMAGRRDRLVSPQAMQSAAAMCSHSHYYEFAHGGHAPFITESSAVAEQIKQFSRELRRD